MKKRTEEFPIDSSVLADFIRVNEKLWNEDHGAGGDIYINLSMVRMQVGWILPKILFAKGLQAKNGGDVIAITWRENPSLTSFLASFGIKHYCIETENSRHPVMLAKAGIKTLSVILSSKTGEGLQKMYIDGIAAGRSIYEDIIRTSDLSTIRDIRTGLCIKKTAHILWMFYSLDQYLKKHKPAYEICDDCAYHEAMQSALFDKHGAKVYNCSGSGIRPVAIKKNGMPMRVAEVMNGNLKRCINELDKSYEEEAVRILEERFAGKNGRNIDRGAFSNKAVLNKEEFIERFKLDPSKKTVVIMAHTFTDAVYNYGEYYFRDYYDWTEETLIMAAADTKVNWVLKPHPTRKAYHENTDSIEALFNRYAREGMAILDDSISAESIKNIADVIVTIGGNAGAEFACLGVPVVIVGKPYYSGLGYTIEPASLSEYQEVLEKADEIAPLTDAQISTARKAFAWRGSKRLKAVTERFSDEFSKEVSGRYKKMYDSMALQFFESNKGTRNYNSDLLKYVTEYFSGHDPKECDYFVTGRDLS